MTQLDHDISGDELPNLWTLLDVADSKSDISHNPTRDLRRSPRKQACSNPHISENKTESAMSNQSQSPRKADRRSPLKVVKNHSGQKYPSGDTYNYTQDLNVPRCIAVFSEERADENERICFGNKSSTTANQRRTMKLPHVDSLLLPLSKVALMRKSRVGTTEERGKDNQDSTVKSRTTKSRSVASPFILGEAQCNDDEDSSGKDDEEQDEETDLSGFIVDDDAELSYYESSHASDSDSEREARNNKALRNPNISAPRRRLQRGSPSRRRSISSSNENKESGDLLTNAFQQLDLSDQQDQHNNEIEVVDLTSSPARPSLASVGSSSRSDRPHNSKHEASGQTTQSIPSSLFDDFDAILKFSPPRSYSPVKIPSRMETTSSIFTKDAVPSTTNVESPTKSGFTTPPATPPRSPTKLKSPSKLLSPSKRGDLIPKSPHRQSMDAFWDIDVVNGWNDQYSPRKAPATSPAKSRFMIWDDSDNGSDRGWLETSDSLPSPCVSPTRSRSPAKSPEKAEAKRLAQEKRATVARKKDFEAQRERLAAELLLELDTCVTSSQIGAMSESTGGVKVIWSKTLRSTAGRANWRRTVTKPSGSPVKNISGDNVNGVKVQHFANIELAEKVIDNEERLVNTLAHEFCHLANFMVSGIKDQPHGASFKSWAAKVTRHLRSSSSHNNSVWRKVEVTTKHSYVINHKYLWACAGREKTKAMEFLHVEDEGCGAEYGRHSKSIDAEKHRCGRCKGLLVQVRPKPRAGGGRTSPVKKSTAVTRAGSVESESFDGSHRSSSVEVVELSD